MNSRITVRRRSFALSVLALSLSLSTCHAFVHKSAITAPSATQHHTIPRHNKIPAHVQQSNIVDNGSRRPTMLHMGLDMLTYMRTEWISAALCTNQTPRAAKVCLQLGCEDGRAVTFIPKTVRELQTSSAEPDGKLPLSASRQLKQQAKRRGAARVTLIDQPADDLRETEDESVDVVISLQAAERMRRNGLDWKKSIEEAARVLKPGGRFLFVEQTQVAGESYLEYVENLKDMTALSKADSEDEVNAIFDEVGSDKVNLVLVPHIAGIALKSEVAGLTQQEIDRNERQEERGRLQDIAIEAYEGGLKRKKRKKKKTESETKGMGN